MFSMDDSKTTLGGFISAMGVDPGKFTVVNVATTGVGNSAALLEVAACSPDGVCANWFATGSDPEANYDFTRIDPEEYARRAVPAPEVWAMARKWHEGRGGGFIVMNERRWNEKLVSEGRAAFWWCSKPTLDGTGTFCVQNYDAVRRSGEDLAGYEDFAVMCRDFGLRTLPGRKCPTRKLDALLEARGVKVPENGTVAVRKAAAMAGLFLKMLDDPAFGPLP